ncbi:hypothetical protein EV421DRAFT_1102737 [Armillaria borealis]|uniref:Uncharacterized protein n=1 Tax=Armillaria borealis TaxID=47425 RepID=A0AA39J6P6_9AGAR|nr:hypothetical protein EV421DRAFT_1102737 [Armillaria borealis]
MAASAIFALQARSCFATSPQAYKAHLCSTIVSNGWRPGGALRQPPATSPFLPSQRKGTPSSSISWRKYYQGDAYIQHPDISSKLGLPYRMYYILVTTTS